MEALLTIVILSVSLTVIVQGVTAAYRASRMGWRYSEAALALENAAVEKIFQGGLASGIDEDGNLEKPFSRYHYKILSQPAVINGLSNNRINDVTLSVAWNDGAKSHAVDFETFLFNTTPAVSDEK